MTSVLRSPSLVVLSLSVTLLYLGLGVLGWGGLGAFFANPARMAAAPVLFALAVASLFTQGNLSAGEREDRGNRWVLPVFGIIGLLLAWLPAYTDRLDLWTFGGDGVRWLGVLLFAFGGALRLWPVFVLGNRFSGLVAIQRGHRLVTDGPYSIVRHPSYAGLLICSLGWALVFRSGAGVLLVLLLIPPLIARMNAEEALLRDNFGAAYEAYRARTARLVPGLY